MYNGYNYQYYGGTYMNTNMDRDDYKAKAEYNNLKAVFVHRPGIESFFGTLDAAANCFLSKFNYEDAQIEHDTLVTSLQNEGVNTLYARDALSNDDIDVYLFEKALQVFKLDLFTEMHQSLINRFDVNNNNLNTTQIIDDFFSNYSISSGTESLRRTNKLKSHDKHSKFQMLLLNLKIRRHGPKHSQITSDVPLSNYYFQRDQQFLGDKGFVMSAMKERVRQNEPALNQFIFNVKKIPITYGTNNHSLINIGETKDKIEGGDFIPAGDFALIGIGERTNRNTVTKILLNSAISYDEVILVYSPIKTYIELTKLPIDVAKMKIMHLDTWFNILGKGLTFSCTKLMDAAKIEIYYRTNGHYSTESTNNKQSFSTYLSEKGYDNCEMDFEELPEACNFLTLRDRKIMPFDFRKTK